VWARQVNALTEPEGQTPTKDLPFIDITPEIIAGMLTPQKGGCTFRVSKHGLPEGCEVRQAVIINRAIGPRACRKGTQILRLYLEPPCVDYADGFHYWLEGDPTRLDLRPVEMQMIPADAETGIEEHFPAVVVERGQMPRETRAVLNTLREATIDYEESGLDVPSYEAGVAAAIAMFEEFYKAREGEQ